MESAPSPIPPTDPSPESALVAVLTDIQLSLQYYVRSLLPGDSAANDVAQQANTKIWEKRAEFEPGTNFKAWAFSIARYEVLSYSRRNAGEICGVWNDANEQYQ